MDKKLFEENLRKYARLAVEVGINLKEKEGLILNGNINSLEISRYIVEEAYKLGAKDVIFQFNDDEMSLIRYENAKGFAFDHYPKWKVDYLESMYKDNYHHLFILSSDPNLLKDIDGDLIAKDQKVRSEAMSQVMSYRMTGKTKWNIIAVPSPEWALSVFPDLSLEDAMEKLWKNVFSATRVSLEDPVEGWKTHDKNLKKYRNYLNDKDFEKLHFLSKDTDLEVYLAQDHFWMGGSKESLSGDPYVANIPTEEVFTTPYKTKVNGFVKSTKPLSLNGKLINDFGFTFKDGKVVDFYADQGYDTLKNLLENDEGAVYLGEVALVQDDSPISNTNLLFNETLFDENASCHLALGRAYPYAMKNGSNMTEDQLKAKGSNYSLIHVDFMIGSPDLEITGYEKNGSSIKLFENGNWTF